MTHETSRLILRPWHESDASDLFMYAKNPLVGPIAGWPPHSSIDESLNIIRTVFSKPETYAITLKTDRKAIGCIGLIFGKDSNIYELHEKEAEIGYWLGVPFWGQGMVPEAVEGILKHAFNDLDLEQIWCGYYSGNLRSKRVAEKCGFRYKYSTKERLCTQMNEMRIEHIYCLTAKEYNSFMLR